MNKETWMWDLIWHRYWKSPLKQLRHTPGECEWAGEGTWWNLRVMVTCAAQTDLNDFFRMERVDEPCSLGSTLICLTRHEPGRGGTSLSALRERSQLCSPQTVTQWCLEAALTRRSKAHLICFPLETSRLSPYIMTEQTVPLPHFPWYLSWPGLFAQGEYRK